MNIDLTPLKQILAGFGELLDIAGKVFIGLGLLYFYFQWRADDGKGMQNGLFMILGAVGALAVGSYFKTLIP
ncbi:hypothetical protein [Arachnia propionica]|uniref:Uncharacterized protein n=1 Tax=Arachnia propionica TaxID=1750 RepID=A0A3P1WXQ7_9ACTN|nr:hypothetical protein [Arachnia propionica]RRD50537.1 hypothetical protein EII35_03810 [Arachnia propionica]